MKRVRDIMSTSFHTLSPTLPVSQAVGIFKSASIAEGRTIFGMMVMDETRQLVGILSM